MGKRLRDKSDGWKDFVGNPDEWDLKNVQTCIDNFRANKYRECEVYDFGEHECQHKKTITGAQWITMSVEQSRQLTETGFNPINEHGVKNKESDARIVSSIPVALWNELSDTMPTIFREKTHFEWFVKHFKKYFLVPEKY